MRRRLSDWLSDRLSGVPARPPSYRARWWAPRSMFGRNLLLLIGLILLAEVGIGLIFRQWVQAPRAVAMQQFVVAQAHAQRQFLLRLDEAGRRTWQQQLGARLGRQSAPRAAAPDSLWLSRFMQDVASELNPAQFQLRWQQQPVASLWLGMRIEQEWLWQELDSSALHPNLPSLVLWVLIGGGGLALMGAYLIQRRINRPLQELAAAALAFGQGQAQNLPFQFETGQQAPLEIAQLARSMQGMAQDLAAAEQERALMLAGVSHDLRTPLTKLRLAVEILSASSLAAEEAPLLQGMVQHIASANQVIQQFIDFARSASDEPMQDVAIHSMLAQLVDELSPHEKAQVQLNTAAITFRCRPVALRRALQNLLENALRHGLPGPNQAPSAQAAQATPAPAIQLQARCEANTLVLTVSDHGPGIPEPERERMRQPFARLHPGIAGAGLGLAIVERIVALHQGQMRLAQVQEGGLQVSLHLPMAPG